MQKHLESRPDLLDGIAPETRQALQNGLALHTDMIKYELDREAMTLESRTLADVIGKATGVLGALLPEAKAGGEAAKLLAGAGHRKQAARIRQLGEQAITPRRLLLNLREMLVRLP